MLIYIILSLTMLFWGLSFIWYKQVLVEIKPITLIFFRLILASITLWIYLIAIKKIPKIYLKDSWLFIGLAFFEPFLYFLGESYGIQYVSSSLAAILIATIPLFTPFTSYIFFREKLSVRNYIGIVISFGGVLLVILNDSSAYSFSVKGLLLIMLAVFSTQGYLVMLRKVTSRYSTSGIVVIQHTIGIFLFLPLFLIVDLKGFQIKNLLSVWVPLLSLAILCSMVAFLLFTKGVKEIGISRANVFANFIPVYTAIAAYLLLSEPMQLQKILGMAVAIIGVILTQIQSKTKTKIIAVS